MARRTIRVSLLSQTLDLLDGHENADVIELFALVAPGTRVEVIE